ncbi:MAG TPA: LpxD N-terminal domain-containing protein [Acidiferrobacterales bacterium]|nr:LpxD N-terminal domain-containing protein [Acidiferrobacterales bacterium]
MGATLAELAHRCHGELRGDPDYQAERIAALETAGPHDIAFVAGGKYYAQLVVTHAGAVVLGNADAGLYSGNALPSENPRLCFTRVAAMLHPPVRPPAGFHASAVVDAAADVSADAAIGPQAVIESGARIGEGTAIAACVGIAGSTHVGKRCTLAGQVGVVGHIEITDDVHITGAAVVSHTIREPGTCSSGTPLEAYSGWPRNAVRMRQLDDMARRLKKLEQKLSALSEGGKVEE